MTAALFTDLDGTLVDARDGAVEPARPALAQLRTAGIPVIPCTSKSIEETVAWMRRLDITGPAVAENGGAIVEPDGRWVALGPPRELLDRAMEAIRRMTSGGVVTLPEMTDEETARVTGLGLEDASRTRVRRFNLPFLFREERSAWVEGARRWAGRFGLQLSRGGRFWHLHGCSDKGVAARIVAARLGARRTAAIGDAPNDIPMLLACDRRYVVARPDGLHDPQMREPPGAVLVPAPGPEGWTLAVQDFLASLAA